MKAVVIEQSGILSVIQRDIPSPGADEVLVKVQYCGICSTDSMIYHGIYSRDKLPLIPGHEFTGYIAATGSNVKNWKEGDYVTADINVGCGTCRYCLQNQPLACSEIEQLGIHRDGAFAEYLLIPVNKIIPLTGKADPLEYALAEPLSNVVRSVGRCGSLLGRSVAVLGGNFMTLLHVQIARLTGAYPVTLITNNPAVSYLGSSMGADTVLTMKQAGLADSFSPKGFDFVFETEGSVVSYTMAHQIVAAGGLLLAFGLPPQGEMVEYEPFNLVLKEQRVVSSVAGSGMDIYNAIALIESGRLNLKEFTETVLTLDEVGRGLDLSEMDKSIFKVLIEVSK